MTESLLPVESRRTLMKVCIGVAGAIGLIVVWGWILDVTAIKSIVPGYITMKLNTALCFLVQAVTMACLCARRPTRAMRGLGYLGALASLALVGATLAEYLLGQDLGIDEFFVRDLEARSGHFPPGRLAPITAVNFALMSLAMLSAQWRDGRFVRVGQFLSFLVFFAGFQSLFGYAIGMSYVFGSAFYTQMAIHTAVGFIGLSVAFLVAFTDRGYLPAFTAQTPISNMSVRLLITALFAPPLTRWVCKVFFDRGWFDSNFEMLFQVMGAAIIMSLVVLRAAQALHEIDRQRMESLDALNASVRTRDEFLSIASHELKTPLTSLRLQTQITQRQLSKKQFDMLTPENIGRSLEISERQIGRLTHTVQDMLDVSRINIGQLKLNMETCELDSLVRDIVERLVCQFEAERVALSIETEPVAVVADPFRIEQVVTNLLINALRYGQKQPVRIVVRRARDQALIEVIDQGPGIAVEHQERVFERFERAISANEVSGLGLGLFISRNIVEGHHGTLTVKSQPGSGAVFTAAFPVAVDVSPSLNA